MEPTTTRPVRAKIVAIVPVAELEGAKSRLGGTLDAEERVDLVARMIERTVAAAVATPGIAETIVVTPDDHVRALALRAGGRPIRQRSQGLNDGLREARDEAIAAGAEAIVVVPIDLPLVSPTAIADVLAVLEQTDRPIVGIVPDRRGRGTNALVLGPADAIDFAFGRDSRRAHAALAGAAGATLVEIDGPLSLDLDTPDDLLLIEQIDPSAVHAH